MEYLMDSMDSIWNNLGKVKTSIATLSLLLVCTVVVGVVERWLQEVVVGGSGSNTCAYEGGRKGSNRLEKLPVLEDEQVTCWFRVGLLDLETMVKLYSWPSSPPLSHFLK